MQQLLPKLRNLSIWVSAAILTALPCLVALDYAGVLKWTQWAAGAAVLLAALLALPALTDREHQGGLGFHWLALLLLGWAGFAWFQTLPLPDSLHSFLSPGSEAAYTTWLSPIVGSAAADASHPISVDPWSTKHASAMLLMVVTLAWTSATVFQTRARLATILVGLATGAAIHGALGIFQLVVPDTTLLGMDVARHGSPFAAFVCRNNAALLMNIGVGASLGLLAWRLSALIGQEVDDEHFELNDLISLVSDRDSSIAMVSLVLCSSAILVCGSRGGLVAALFGFVLGFGWIRARRSILSIPVIVGVVAVAVIMLLVPLNLDLESIQRLEIFVNRDNSTLMHDGRIPHWSDGFQAAKAYLPMGSGLGTYADAHLPYLDRSAETWFHHADNLWLELLTEQGLPGVMFAIVLIVGLLISLHHLRESPDAVDHGLRVAGWYILSAIVISQIFDFGLIIPANLLACGVFLPIVATRQFLLASHLRKDQAAEDADFEDRASEEKSPKIKFQTRRTFVVPALVAAAAIVPSVWALSVLSTDAKIEALARQSRFELDSKKPDSDKLDHFVSELTLLAEKSHSPEAYRTLSDLHHRLARYEEVASANPKSIEQIQELYRQTSPVIRRLTWLKQQPGVSMTSGSGSSQDASPENLDALAGNADLSPHYRQALENTEAELVARPLSRESRSSGIYLDFLNSDHARTRTLLNQLQSLYKTNTKATQQIGGLALDSNEHDIAAECFRNVLERQPRYTTSILRIMEEHPEITPSEIVPPTSGNYRQAAKFLINRPEPDSKFLTAAYAGLACDTCETIAERAKCEELAGDTAYVLEKFDEAYDAYQEAIKFKPNDTRLRIKLIGRLRQQNRREEALTEARKARIVMPDEDRFDVIIREIAQAELQDFKAP
ncbi:O-Antigen ligase [Planctomycetes bacterium CA13]|uniref:O-Antigen ligase n=1 Tax=Novipirellula herctigrandis TaxID=2527986 RepID=A0A5C5ZAP6_9BACT|nr:O-Antigen ligase [Planctomycetes bacterium CA13]